jgi:hypothetical protein
MNTAEIISSLELNSQKLTTSSLDLSFNEIASMYEDGEININPEYQRVFRWTEGARSRFIETLLLELPVPPIYVVEDSDGKYQLIDGLQRISSYLHFRGMLDASHFDPPIIPGQFLELTDCDIVKELNGLTYNDLGTALQLRAKRAFVRVEVVRKASDPRFKYHLFKRLNTGGIPLTNQQLRNCTARMLNPDFLNFINTLSQTTDYRICVENLTEEQFLGSFEQELVLRFFALKNRLDRFKHDVADFLTEYLEEVSDPVVPANFNYAQEKVVFEKTFMLLNASWGGSAFSRTKPKDQNSLSKSFMIYHFEAFTLGIQSILDKLNPEDNTHIDKLKASILEIKQDNLFVTLTTGGGKNSPGPLRDRINFVSNRFSQIVF